MGLERARAAQSLKYSWRSAWKTENIHGTSLNTTTGSAMKPHQGTAAPFAPVAHHQVQFPSSQPVLGRGLAMTRGLGAFISSPSSCNLYLETKNIHQIYTVSPYRSRQVKSQHCKISARGPGSPSAAPTYGASREPKEPYPTSGTEVPFGEAFLNPREDGKRPRGWEMTACSVPSGHQPCPRALPRRCPGAAAPPGTSSIKCEPCHPTVFPFFSVFFWFSLSKICSSSEPTRGICRGEVAWLGARVALLAAARPFLFVF